ncbi:hypothetical protein L207DRAFT_565162 [Hyaloscypha variabilis F]|uniref:Cysteine proteinase n=1 Tax=Hyaloscypha variabilis (strain UAMH 11265 / GT02V1 / F) TaxID=1149755 RepID=A0A2J6RRR0_HYAVF|nr:hypothetical protein L207DRAFT_565162 [Hyaloscypha variabilis F]
MADGGLIKNPSRLFIYYNARALETMDDSDPETLHWPVAVTDDGSQVRNALKAICNFGIAPESTWPYDMQTGWTYADKSNDDVIGVNDRPPAAAYEAAAKTHAVEYSRLDSKSNKTVQDYMELEQKITLGKWTLDNVRLCLIEGYPVIFGYNSFYPSKEKWDWPDATSKDKYPSLKPIPAGREHKGPDPDGKFGFGHAVLTVGFEDLGDDKHPYKGRILVQNSWGPDITSKAHFWMPYEYIMDWEATDDFWMIREVKTAAPPANRPQVKGNAATETPLPAGWKKLNPITNNKSVALSGAATIAGVGNTTTDCHYWWINKQGGSITALSWKSDHVGVFWVSPDVAVHQAVRGSLTDLTHPWEKFLVALAKSAVPLSSLAACSLDVNHTEVYWVSRGAKMGYYVQKCTWKAGWQPAERLSRDFMVGPQSRLTCTVEKGGKGITPWFVTTCGGVREYVWDKSAKEWYYGWVAAPWENRIDSDVKAISVENAVSHVVWVGPDNSLRTNHSHSTGSKITKVTGPGTVQAGSPLGLYTRKEKSFSVSYMDNAGELVVLEYGDSG